MSVKGSRRVADVLRLSDGTLAARLDVEPDRVDVRDGASAARQDEGERQPTACLTMVFRLMESASRKWRALNGSGMNKEMSAGAVFVDGLKQTQAA